MIRQARRMALIGGLALTLGAGAAATAGAASAVACTINCGGGAAVRPTQATQVYMAPPAPVYRITDGVVRGRYEFTVVTLHITERYGAAERGLVVAARYLTWRFPGGRTQPTMKQEVQLLTLVAGGKLDVVTMQGTVDLASAVVVAEFYQPLKDGLAPAGPAQFLGLTIAGLSASASGWYTYGNTFRFAPGTP